MININNNIISDSGKGNQMVVIGAGLPRTGTTSMKNALEELLGAKCYHMEEVVFGGQPEVERRHWDKARLNHQKPEQKILTDQDWIDFLPGRGFKAGVDYPISLYYK